MTTDVANQYSSIIRKFGIAGFAFFLIKGLLWLIVPFMFAWFI
ncbi:MAG: hypothetical protein ACR2Q3_14490 [Woeseiaceae bacterium]